MNDCKLHPGASGCGCQDGNPGLDQGQSSGSGAGPLLTAEMASDLEDEFLPHPKPWGVTYKAQVRKALAAIASGAAVVIPADMWEQALREKADWEANKERRAPAAASDAAREPGFWHLPIAAPTDEEMKAGNEPALPGAPYRDPEFDGIEDTPAYKAIEAQAHEPTERQIAEAVAPTQKHIRHERVRMLIREMTLSANKLITPPAPRYDEEFSKGVDWLGRDAEGQPSVPSEPAGALFVIFDGPPGPEAGRFVEVETAEGRSVQLGKWSERSGGLWALGPCYAEEHTLPYWVVVGHSGQIVQHTAGKGGWRFTVYTNEAEAQAVADSWNADRRGGRKDFTVKSLSSAPAVNDSERDAAAMRANLLHLQWSLDDAHRAVWLIYEAFLTGETVRSFVKQEGDALQDVREIVESLKALGWSPALARKEREAIVTAMHSCAPATSPGTTEAGEEKK